MPNQNNDLTPRFCILQPDYLLYIVLKPRDWRPNSLTAIPPFPIILRSYRIASFDEAIDDVLKCNRHSMEHSLDTWAIVQSADQDFNGDDHGPR